MEQPTEIAHTEECLKRQVECTVYATRWPNFCRNCYGKGYWQTSSTYWEPSDGGPCSCVEQGFCPRCGEKSIIMDNDGICDCTACGWSDRCFAEKTPMPEGLICPDTYCYCIDELGWDYYMEEFLP